MYWYRGQNGEPCLPSNCKLRKEWTGKGVPYTISYYPASGNMDRSYLVNQLRAEKRQKGRQLPMCVNDSRGAKIQPALSRAAVGRIRKLVPANRVRRLKPGLWKCDAITTLSAGEKHRSRCPSMLTEQEQLV